MSAYSPEVHPSDNVETDWFEVCKRNGWTYEPPKPNKRKERRSVYSALGEEERLCGSTVVVLECERFLHDKGKRIFCGREWCFTRCGKDDSEMHKRRYGRLVPKVFYMGNAGKSYGLGYFIFTVPLQVRAKLRSKKRLQEVGCVIRNILKRHGFKIGISRWHFFGDGYIEEDRIGHPLNLGVYHPHLNSLVVGRWVADSELRKIKEAWRKYLEALLGESIDVVDVWYQFYKNKGQWWHKATYVTRSTFKQLEGNEPLAKTLFNFRNVVYWGFGRKERREEKEALGLTVFKNWLEELEAKKKEEREEEESLTKEKGLALALLSKMLCPECYSIDGRIVKLIAKRNIKTGEIFVIGYEQLKDEGLIQSEYDSGFFDLKPITPDVMY